LTLACSLATTRLASITLLSLLFLFYCSGAPRDLHSFPTRRSSDLTSAGVTQAVNAKPSDIDAGIPGNGIDAGAPVDTAAPVDSRDRKSTRLNSSHSQISYAVFCLKKKKKKTQTTQDHTDSVRVTTS